MTIHQIYPAYTIIKSTHYPYPYEYPSYQTYMESRHYIQNYSVKYLTHMIHTHPSSLYMLFNLDCDSRRSRMLLNMSIHNTLLKYKPLISYLYGHLSLISLIPVLYSSCFIKKLPKEKKGRELPSLFNNSLILMIPRPVKRIIHRKSLHTVRTYKM